MIEVEVTSSLIDMIKYDIDTYELTIVFNPKYFIKHETRINCPPDYFDAFVNAPSVGKHYNEYIKPYLKLKTMADEKKKLPTKNKSSQKTRQIDLSIDVNMLNKEWFYTSDRINKKGKNAVYAKLRLLMRPDGEVDKYGNLGMIVEVVPTEIYKAEKNLPDDQKTQGAILGNGTEIDWDAINGGPGSAENVSMGVTEEIEDDLPF